MFSNKTLLFALLLSAVGCSHKQEAAAVKPPAALSVKTVAVEQTEWPEIREFTATVKARVSTVIASKVMGYVKQVSVETGARVAAGKVLVTLEAQELESGVQQAEAGRTEARQALAETEQAIRGADSQVELARITHQRIKDLFEKRSVSNQEFDEAVARLRQAEAGLAAARSRRSQVEAKIQQTDAAANTAVITRGYTQLRAPFAGVVTERHVEPGVLAVPGMPLLTIEEAGSYRVEAAVEESLSGSLKIGRQLETTIDAIRITKLLPVVEIVPSVDAASRSFVVKLDASGIGNLRSGMFARVRMPLEARRALTIPTEALRVNGQLTSVFLVENKVARQRLITVGAVRGNRVEALSGLADGERIVSPCPEGLNDGAAIEVRQ